MPIKAKLLYPFRWWFRATVANSAPIVTNSLPNSATPAASIAAKRKK